MSGPLPSQLVFLTDLVKCKPQDKVRFLGCVEKYEIASATVILKHQYPATAPPVVALVNIDHVLESIEGVELEVGVWLNVIGYVGNIQKGTATEEHSGRKCADGQIHVQALVLWSAENIRVDAYEKALEQRLRPMS